MREGWGELTKFQARVKERWVLVVLLLLVLPLVMFLVLMLMLMLVMMLVLTPARYPMSKTELQTDRLYVDGRMFVWNNRAEKVSSMNKQ